MIDSPQAKPRDVYIRRRTPKGKWHRDTVCHEDEAAYHLQELERWNPDHRFIARYSDGTPFGTPFGGWEQKRG